MIPPQFQQTANVQQELLQQSIRRIVSEQTIADFVLVFMGLGGKKGGGVTEQVSVKTMDCRRELYFVRMMTIGSWEVFPTAKVKRAMVGYQKM
jgi:hypothetical protein